MTKYCFDTIEDKKKYWDGSKNRIIRYYFYVQAGLALLNEFRYLIMSVLAVYALLKLQNPVWMLIMFCGAIPVLLCLGWISVHKMEKTMEFYKTHFSTHYQKYNITLQEQQRDILEKIQKSIKGNL